MLYHKMTFSLSIWHFLCLSVPDKSHLRRFYQPKCQVLQRSYRENGSVVTGWKQLSKKHTSKQQVYHRSYRYKRSVNEYKVRTEHTTSA